MTFKTDLKTQSARRQYGFDQILEEEDVSGLRFLKHNYRDKLNDYRNSHDLNNQIYAQEYKEMQQRYKMISEELSNRVRLLKESKLASKDVHFNDNYDIIVEEENGEIKIFHPSIHNSTIEIIEIDEDDVRD